MTYLIEVLKARFFSHGNTYTFEYRARSPLVSWHSEDHPGHRGTGWACRSSHRVCTSRRHAHLCASTPGRRGRYLCGRRRSHFFLWGDGHGCHCRYFVVSTAECTPTPRSRQVCAFAVSNLDDGNRVCTPYLAHRRTWSGIVALSTTIRFARADSTIGSAAH